MQLRECYDTNMLNQESIQVVNESAFSTQFRKPIYDTYGFANLPDTILQAFGIPGTPELKPLPATVLHNLPQQYDKVILLFVDAFGWRFFEKYKNEYPVLQHLLQNGVISKLTSQFPSTTAAHVTTINTGLPVGEHGVYEWNYYEPTLDAVIQPLFFSYAGEKQRETLAQINADHSILFPTNTLHQKLAGNGIQSTVYSPEEFGDSAYTNMVMNGSQVKPYKTLTEGFINLTTQVSQSEKGYFYFYYGDIDKMGHTYGPESSQFAAQISTFLHALETYLIGSLEGKTNKTLLLMTADHGQVYAAPEKAIYLNQLFPEIIPLLQTTATGNPIIPAGSGRDFFLHVQSDHLQQVKALLTEKLQGKAEVYETTQLIEQGFFGPLPVSEKFLSRVGNLVVLPYKNYLVWWFEEGVFKQKHIGHHGGLTPEEIETILYAYAL